MRIVKYFWHIRSVSGVPQTIHTERYLSLKNLPDCFWQCRSRWDSSLLSASSYGPEVINLFSNLRLKHVNWWILSVCSGSTNQLAWVWVDNKFYNIGPWIYIIENLNIFYEFWKHEQCKSWRVWLPLSDKIHVNATDFENNPKVFWSFWSPCVNTRICEFCARKRNTCL